MHGACEVNATTKFGLSQVAAEGRYPAPEIAGDVFDRQRVMKDFDQSLVESQHVLVLGVGGIGSCVAMCLVRMGVETMHLLDRDYVEASNLNRQILFSPSDVGSSKAERAALCLREKHNLRSEIHHYHMDAITNWSVVVRIAKQCSVVFNNIDYGSMFDYAVNSLCKSLGIVYVSGATYANNIDINLYSGSPNDSCWACANHTNDPFKFSDEELDHFDDVSSFLKEKRSVAGDRASSIIEQCLNELGCSAPSRTQFVSSFMPLYQRKLLRLLLPEHIQSYDSIEFIPKDRSFPTRAVGSWIGVCVSGSCLLVNTWVKYIMKTRTSAVDGKSSLHNWMQLNLGMFDGAYAVASFQNEQDRDCWVCRSVRDRDMAASTASEMRKQLIGGVESI